MTSPKSAKRAAATAPGVKLLITAASFAATIGGWALIGAKEDAAAQTVVAPDVAPIAVVPQPTTELTIKLDPLPTLVPQPTPQSQRVTTNSQPAVAARPASPQPAAAAPAMPALRVVTAPDGGGGGNGGGGAAPVATTRSSK